MTPGRSGSAGRLLFGLSVTAIVLAGLVARQALATPNDPAAAYGDRSLLEHGETTAYTGSQITITDSLRTFDRTVRIGSADAGLVLDRTELVCHGGRARITWHVGNLEPTVPDTALHLSIRLDGERIASMQRGSTRGIFNDDPTQIVTVADCPAGAHVLDLFVERVDGGWGIPYVTSTDYDEATGLLVQRGFVVTEMWG